MKSVRAKGRRLILLGCAALLLLVGGCGSIHYYGQAVAGQYEILSRREPIQKVIARSDTKPDLRAKLQLVLELRAFAERDLKLKTDGHYDRYADLGRRYVVWNVYAAPELSVEPKRWWYPVVGRLKYRGFFSEQDARDYGARLARDGFDVHVGGVEAYSTLGWFEDPVLNTFIHHRAPDLAETLFHELAHQRVFASGETDFNEAFATAVAEEGVRRWLAAHGDAKARADYETELRRQNQFVALVLHAREELKLVYGEKPHSTNDHATIADQRARKAEVIAKLRAGHEQLKASWGGDTDYDQWFQKPINNARLNTIATYHHLVPAFQKLLENSGGDLEKFYAEATVLAKLRKEERQQRMAALIALPR